MKNTKTIIALSYDKKQEIVNYLKDDIIYNNPNSRILLVNLDNYQEEYLLENNLAKINTTPDIDFTYILSISTDTESLKDPSLPGEEEFKVSGPFRPGGLHSETKEPIIDNLIDNFDDNLLKNKINLYENGNIGDSDTEIQNKEELFANISLDYYGKNVDVFIFDDSCPPVNHPEFLSNDDNSGISRVQPVDWHKTNDYKPLNTNLWPIEINRYTYYDQRFLANKQPGRNTPGGFHGVHVAGIACGNTTGWARKSNVYYSHMNDWYYQLVTVPPGPGGPGYTQYIPIAWNGAEIILNFHRNKPINPHTGLRNPTIVNMSFGTLTLGRYINSISKICYRGVIYERPAFDPGGPGGNPPPTGGWGNGDRYEAIAQLMFQFGMTLSQDAAGTLFMRPHGWSGNEQDTPILIPYIEEMLEAGIILVAAAGNDYNRADKPGGPDYDNYYLVEGSDFRFYYHRGSVPASVPGVIVVGSMSPGYPEYKSSFSTTGRLVDIYAPGGGIMSTTIEHGNDGCDCGFYATLCNFGVIKDSRDQTYRFLKLSGTSMAAPQITGMLACYAEKEPTITPQSAKAWLLANAQPTLGDVDFETAASADPFEWTKSLQGGNNQVAYFPYGSYTLIQTSDSDSDIPTEILPDDSDSGVDVSITNVQIQPIISQYNVLPPDYKLNWSIQWSGSLFSSDFVGYRIIYSGDNGATWESSGETHVMTNALQKTDAIDCMDYEINEKSGCGFIFKVCYVNSQGEEVLCSDECKFRFNSYCGPGANDEGGCDFPEGCCGRWNLDNWFAIYCEYSDYVNVQGCSGSGIIEGDPCGFCGEWKGMQKNTGFPPIKQPSSLLKFCEDKCQIRPGIPGASINWYPKPNLTPTQTVFYNHIMKEIGDRVYGKAGITNFSVVFDWWTQYQNSGRPNFAVSPEPLASDHIKLFSQYDPNDGITPIITRNISCWTNGITNISCTSAMRLMGTNTFNTQWPTNYYEVIQATLITRKHVLFATHFKPDLNSNFIFVDEQNNQFSVKVTNIVDVWGDISVGVLEQEVPQNIKVAKVLPSNFTDYIYVPQFDSARRSPFQFVPSIWSIDQKQRASIYSMGSPSNAIKNYDPNGPNSFGLERASFMFFNVDYGDSGLPVFLIIKNELVVLGTWYAPGIYSALYNRHELINNKIEELSPGGNYSLTVIDLQSTYNELIGSGVSSTLEEEWVLPGCTNHNSRNYLPYATCDDGSCITCCNQSLCVANDQDFGNNCNRISNEDLIFPATYPTRGNNDADGQNGCCDAFCLNNGDCAESFANSFVATMCDGSTITYHSCQECPNV